MNSPYMGKFQVTQTQHSQHDGLDLVGIEESADRALLNVDIDLGAHVIKLVRTIERRDSQKEIGSDSDVCHNDS